MATWGIPNPAIIESQQHVLQFNADQRLSALEARLADIESRTPWGWLAHFWRQLWQ